MTARNVYGYDRTSRTVMPGLEFMQLSLLTFANMFSVPFNSYRKEEKF